MKATQTLHDLGQSLWLDNITRDLLDERHAQALHRRALGDRAHLQPDHLRPRHQEQLGLRRGDPRKVQAGQVGRGRCSSSWRSRISPRPPTCSGRSGTGRDGVDGWVSLEVSPLLAHDTASTAGRRQGPARPRGAAESLHQDPGHQGRPAGHRGGDLRGRADQRDAPVLARALPGGGRGVPARHRAPHRRRAQARGRLGRLGVRQPLGRRGRGQGAGGAANQLGIAIAKRTYKAYRELLGSPRWQRVFNAGARPQRLLWASTGTKDPSASDVLYVKALAAPFTVNTMPEGTLKALADHGAARRRCCRPTAATARRCWRSSPGPASTSTPWPAQLQDEGRQVVRQLLARAHGRDRHRRAPPWPRPS